VWKARPGAGLTLFSYWIPILRRTLDHVCGEVREAGIGGVLVTDLTVEEAGDYIGKMQASELATIFLAAPTSTGRSRTAFKIPASELSSALVRMSTTAQ